MAKASYEMNGVSTSVDSNVAPVQVAEVLDVTFATMTSRGAIGDGVSAVPFVVTNTGNGEEAFEISATVEQTAASVTGYAIDRDGNGVYDPAVDTVLSGNALPALATGARQQVFVLVAGAAAVKGDVTVTATVRAVTGSGATGTNFAGRGDGGGDAVVGKTGAAATAQAVLTPTPAAPTFTKSQSVRAPDGTARALRGATITYTLAAHFNGATPGVTIADPVPAGTGYVAGSITLDGQALSDASDGDAARFDGAAIHVALGDVAGAGDHIITFKTTIQ